MEVKKYKGFSVTSLVLGIITIVNAFFPFSAPLAFILAIIGLVFGLIVVFKTRDQKTPGMAAAGSILSALSIIISVLIIALSVKYLNQAIKDANSNANNYTTTVTRDNTEDKRKERQEEPKVEVEDYSETVVGGDGAVPTIKPDSNNSSSTRQRSYSQDDSEKYSNDYFPQEGPSGSNSNSSSESNGNANEGTNDQNPGNDGNSERNSNYN